MKKSKIILGLVSLLFLGGCDNISVQEAGFNLYLNDLQNLYGETYNLSFKEKEYILLESSVYYSITYDLIRDEVSSEVADYFIYDIDAESISYINHNEYLSIYDDVMSNSLEGTIDYLS